MDNYSEQKSKYKPYSEETVIHARPKPKLPVHNIFLTGDIELFPEYRTSFVPYSLDSIYKYNKPPCYHPKRDKKIKKSSPPPPPPQTYREALRDEDDRRESEAVQMPERDKPMEAKILNNNYGVPCANRYHQKLDSENNNYIPEYQSKYQPFIGKRSSLIPQKDHLTKYDGDDKFNGASEYTNRYKTYDHFTKSAPIKKQDNLHMMGMTEMRPEYKERYQGIDMNTFVRRQPYRQQDNLQSEGDFGRDMPEYHEKYKDHHISSFPERAKPKNDFLCLNGEMDYSPEYRNNYVEFPRQRPVMKRAPSNIRMPTTHERDRKNDNIDLPINLSYHETGSTRPMRMGSQDEEEIPIERRPEYRRAMHNYMMKERSPSRASDNEQPQNDKTIKVTDPNDVSKVLMENKVNLQPEKIFDDNNEIIVEPLKKPENFKIPTRSPVRHPSGKGPSYPLQAENRYNGQESSMKRNSGRRGNFKVVIDDYDGQSQREPSHFDSSHPSANVMYETKQTKSPKYGRRAPNPAEEYNIRTKTNVVEANPRYVRERRSDIQANRHEQRGYYHQSNAHPMPMSQAPADSLANNYRPSYETDKQHNYRESLKDQRQPFVVIDQQNGRGGGVKPNSWMKKQWYDTQ